jgi:hypothetical protein
MRHPAFLLISATPTPSMPRSRNRRPAAQCRAILGGLSLVTFNETSSLKIPDIKDCDHHYSA